MPIGNVKEKAPVTKVAVGEVMAVEQMVNGGGGPVAQWHLCYVTQASELGNATEVRLCGFTKPTLVRHLGATLWAIGGPKQELALALAERLRPLDNRWESKEALMGAIAGPKL